LKKEIIILLAILVLPIIGFIATTSAQETITDLIALSPNKLNFYCKEGELSVTQKISLIGISDESTTVKFIPTDLYDNSSSNFLSFEPITLVTDFTRDSNPRRVSITLDVSDAKAGTYQGSIIVLASTPSKFNTTSIEVIAQITSEKPIISISQTATILLLFIPMGLALAWDDKWDNKLKFKAKYLLIAIFILEIISMAYLMYIETTYEPEYIFLETTIQDVIAMPFLIAGAILIWFMIRKKSLLNAELTLKKIYAIVFLGMLVAAVTIFAIVNSIFGDLTILSTVLLTPFFAHIIGYAKDKRDTDKESRKSANKLYNSGIETALKFLTDVLGETSNHYSSLKSKNYLPNGNLKRKKWDESSTKGLLPEIPLGYLAKYYSFVDLHNTYYSIAYKIQEAKKEIPPGSENICKNHKTLCDKILLKFNSFRMKYSELEETIFGYLTYTKWILCEEYLRPLDVDLQLPSRGLLNHLVDRGILLPSNFIKSKNLAYEVYGGKTELKTAINDLKSDLMEQIKSEIYNLTNRSIIRKELTSYFDKIYGELENSSSSLPHINKDLRDKPAKSPPLKIDSTLKIN
jgi:hypothetical protein